MRHQFTIWRHHKAWSNCTLQYQCSVGYNLYHHCTVAYSTTTVGPPEKPSENKACFHNCLFSPCWIFGQVYTLCYFSMLSSQVANRDTQPEWTRLKKIQKWIEETKVEWHAHVELVLTKGRPSKSASPFTSCSFWIFWRAPDWAPSLSPSTERPEYSVRAKCHTSNFKWHFIEQDIKWQKCMWHPWWWWCW